VFVKVHVGVFVGVNVGEFVGVNVGVLVGVHVGELVGVNVGVFVGDTVGVQKPTSTLKLLTVYCPSPATVEFAAMPTQYVVFMAMVRDAIGIQLTPSLE